MISHVLPAGKLALLTTTANDTHSSPSLGTSNSLAKPVVRKARTKPLYVASVDSSSTSDVLDFHEPSELRATITPSLSLILFVNSRVLTTYSVTCVVKR